MVEASRNIHSSPHRQYNFNYNSHKSPTVPYNKWEGTKKRAQVSKDPHAALRMLDTDIIICVETTLAKVTLLSCKYATGPI